MDNPYRCLPDVVQPLPLPLLDDHFYDLEGNSQFEMDNGIHPDATGLRIHNLFRGSLALAPASC